MALSITASSAWTFTQVGVVPTKSLQLTGWSQPFGRPRQGPIVDAGVEIARSITHPGGKHVEPIINAFGDIQAPWHLHGRWMDQAIGIQGGAQLTARAWKDFVEDSQVVYASWNNILAYRIFIQKLKIEYESAAEVVWSMDIDALSDYNDEVITTLAPAQTPLSMSALILDLYPPATLSNPAGGFLASLTNFLAILPNVADQMALLVGQLLTPIAILLTTTQAITDFVSATSSDLLKLAGALSAIQSGLGQFRALSDYLMGQAILTQASYANSPVFAGGPIFSGPDIINLTAAKADADLASSALLAVLADMNAQIAAVRRGRVQTLYAAQLGQTWEQIALATLGSVDGAQALRDINGIRFGTQPQPGRKYQIPAST
jgi:hypothetical protein